MEVGVLNPGTSQDSVNAAFGNGQLIEVNNRSGHGSGVKVAADGWRCAVWSDADVGPRCLLYIDRGLRVIN